MKYIFAIPLFILIIVGALLLLPFALLETIYEILFLKIDKKVTPGF